MKAVPVAVEDSAYILGIGEDLKGELKAMKGVLGGGLVLAWEDLKGELKGPIPSHHGNVLIFNF